MHIFHAYKYHLYMIAFTTSCLISTVSHKSVYPSVSGPEMSFTVSRVDSRKTLMKPSGFWPTFIKSRVDSRKCLQSRVDSRKPFIKSRVDSRKHLFCFKRSVPNHGQLVFTCHSLNMSSPAYVQEASLIQYIKRSSSRCLIHKCHQSICVQVVDPIQ